MERRKYLVTCTCGLKVKIDFQVALDEPIHFIKLSCEQCSRPLFFQQGTPKNTISTTKEKMDTPTQENLHTKTPTAKKETTGGYQFIKKIGEGGMGEIFLAQNQHTGEKAVIKLLKTEHLPDIENEKLIEYFIREAQILKDLDHPNIVKFKSCGNFNGKPYIATEFIQGVDLQSELTTQGALKLSHAVSIIYYLADALEYGHRHNLIHRDIKPANIVLLAPKKTIPKLIDFGLAKTLGTHYHSLTVEGTAMGTPAYMPQEQVKDAKKADQRSDVYSLGATFYHMLVGKAPFYEFADKGEKGMLLAILRKKLTPIGQLRPDLPKQIQKIISTAMAFEPENRYPSAALLKKDLQSFLASLRG